MSTHILVVDDEPEIRGLLKEILEDEDYQVSVAENAEQARQARRQRRPDLVLLDIWMPDTDGISLLKEWAGSDGGLDIPVIVMSGHGTVETAVEATRLGAYDFIEKPLSHAKLTLTISRALETASLQRDIQGLKSKSETIDEPVGNSIVMKRLRDQIRLLATHQTGVLITGESGSGKELFARYLHAQSARHNGPFVSVNVGGLARENPAVPLFGSEEGGRVHFGYLEQANGGTVYLSDVADLDMNLQSRLLSALQTQSLLRVGGLDNVSVDVRIIASTRKNLADEVVAGRFRDDLYYHLNVVPIHVPPLRDHLEDIPEIVDHYLARLSEREGITPRRMTPAAKNTLRRYQWPGNCHELKNLVQRLLILGNGQDIEASEVENALGISVRSRELGPPPGFDKPLRDAREQFEKEYFEYQLQESAGNIARVAERAGLERTHLYRKLRALGIDLRSLGLDKR
jgi:DNA-binding NtrC family response regulator